MDQDQIDTNTQEDEEFEKQIEKSLNKQPGGKKSRFRNIYDLI